MDKNANVLFANSSKIIVIKDHNIKTKIGIKNGFNLIFPMILIYVPRN